MSDITNVLKKALEPYVGTLKTWDRHDIVQLFMGFGNTSIYWKDVTEYVNDKDFGGTFTQHAESIISVLNELDIKFDEHPWDNSEFYWTIFADAGTIRADLVKAIEEVGFKCYQHFDSESEDYTVEEIITFDAEPSW
jgi:hypothetical protein